jgi:peptidoglycan hydrolase-like protein with peptidoglycan-binding domain
MQPRHEECQMQLTELPKITQGEHLDQLTFLQVKELQTALSTLGYSITVDGLLGPLTRSAFAHFKSSIAANEPDMIGPDSIKALQTALNNQQRQPTNSDVPPQALNIVKAFEGFSAPAYDDGTGV